MIKLLPLRLKFLNQGFTLIEIVVVLAVLMVIASTSFVGFNRYNQTQRLNSATEDLRNNLNEARSNSLSGFIFQCTSSQSLYGYKMNVDSATSYSIYVICQDNTTLVNLGPTPLPNKIFNLPSGVTFDSISTPVNTSVTFISVSGVPDTAGTFTFKLNSGGNSKTVTVDPTGVIR